MQPFQPSAENAEHFAQQAYALADIIMLMQNAIIQQYRNPDDACAKAEKDQLEIITQHSSNLASAWRQLAMRYDRATLAKYQGPVLQLYLPPNT